MSEPRSAPYKTIGLALAILFLATIPRVWALDYLTTADEYHWVDLSTQFLVDLLSLTPRAVFGDGFPGVTTRWTGVMGLLLNYIVQAPPTNLLDWLNTLDPENFGLLPLMRLPTALITALGVAILYLLVRRLFGEPVALAAGLLLALEPFLVGLSRIIHYDALMVSFMGVAVLGLLAYLGEDRPPVWLLLFSGAAAGLAVLSKATALLLFPYAFLIAVASCWHRERGTLQFDRARAWRVGVSLVGWGVFAGLVVVALWPAMWVDPWGTVGRIAYLSTHFATSPHEAGNYFLGQPVDDPGLFFYPVAFLFRVTPWALAGMLVTPFLLRGRVPRRVGFYLTALWVFVLLFVASMTLGAKKIDRYVLPIIFFADVLAGVGLAYLASLLRPRLRRWRLAGELGMILALALSLVLLWSHTPFYLSYYNPLLGGVRAAAPIIPVGWGRGCELAAEYLNQKDHAADLDVATLHTGSCLEPLLEGTAWSAEVDSLSRYAGLPWYAMDYVVIHLNQVQREKPTKEFLDFFRTLTPEHVVQIAGLDVAWIYRVPETIPEDLLPASRCPVYQISQGNLDNQVRLVNYAVGDATFQREASFAAGETVNLALRWRTDHLLERPYKVFAHLVDGQKRLIAQEDVMLGGWGREKRLQTRSNKKIMSYRSLQIPPATPPGDYTIVVGLYDAETGRRLSLLSEAGQALGTTVDLGTLRVTRPATPPAIADLPIQHPQEVRLSAGLTLLGYDLMPAEGRAGESLSVALYWQAQRDGLADLTVGLELRDAASKIWSRQAGPPADGTYPTTRWVTGEIIRDTHDLTVDAATPPGNLRLLLRVGNSEVPLTTVPIVGRQHVFQAPAVSHPMTTDLEGARFLGYDLASTTVQPGEPMEFTLHWQCLAKMETSYKVFVHLVDAEYETWGQVDRIPCAGECPTTSWLPGEYLVETYQLVPKPETPPGTYRIAIGLYDDQTGARLPRTDGTGDHILLDANITVQGP